MLSTELLTDMRRALVGAGMTEEALASYLDMDLAALQAILNGESDPPVSTVIDVVNALGMCLRLWHPLSGVKPPSTGLLSPHSRVRRLLERR